MVSKVESSKRSGGRGEAASSTHRGQQGNMLHVLREWQGLAEAGVVGGTSAREETAQRGWEHPSWEETGLPRPGQVAAAEPALYTGGL